MKDADTPWKIVLEHYFQDFIDLLLPHVFREIDWTRPHEFLDKELLRIQKISKVGKKISDKLVKVYKKNGEEAWVMIHIEIQGGYEKGFSERMWTYYYRTYDKYKKPLMSIAIYADKSKTWRPRRYQRNLWGCHLLMEYPTIKLIDFIPQMDKLTKSTNPFAKVIRAHLVALMTRGDLTLKLENKLRLVKELYSLGWNDEDIKTLYHFIEYALELPDELENEFTKDIEKYENEVGMHYVTNAERLGEKRGIEQGIVLEKRNILKKLLTRKFGPLEDGVIIYLNKASFDELEKLLEDFLQANSIADLFGNEIFERIK